MTGVANLARLTCDKSLVAAAERLWASTMRKMYVTGGLGAMGEWEGFGPDYFLPNETGMYALVRSATALRRYPQVILKRVPLLDWCSLRTRCSASRRGWQSTAT